MNIEKIKKQIEKQQERIDKNETFIFVDFEMVTHSADDGKAFFWYNIKEAGTWENDQDTTLLNDCITIDFKDFDEKLKEFKNIIEKL